MAVPSAIFAAVQETFRRRGWKFREVENREVVEAEFEVYHTKVRLHVQAFAELNAVSVVAALAGRTPDSRSGLVCEMLMRTNQELTIGNFEFDCDTGHVMFRATNIFSPNKFDHEILASLVHTGLAEADRLTPFLTLLLRMDSAELSKLNLKLFLQREDLLPPVPESPAKT